MEANSIDKLTTLPCILEPTQGLSDRVGDPRLCSIYFVIVSIVGFHCQPHNDTLLLSAKGKGLARPKISSIRGDRPCIRSCHFKPVSPTLVRARSSPEVSSRSLIRKHLVDGFSFRFRNLPPSWRVPPGVLGWALLREPTYLCRFSSSESNETADSVCSRVVLAPDEPSGPEDLLVSRELFAACL